MPADPELLTIERILQRYAAAVAGGVPDERGRENDRHVPPLPADLALYVDRDYLRAPARVRAIVKYLYRRNMSPEEVGKVMNISRQQVYVYEREALWYFRGMWAANGILARFEQRAARLRRRREQEAARSAATSSPASATAEVDRQQRTRSEGRSGSGRIEPDRAASGRVEPDADDCSGKRCGSSPCCCSTGARRLAGAAV